MAIYNPRGTAEQWIKEGKGAIKWTRLSCRALAANAVRLQLHVLAYSLGNFIRTLASLGGHGCQLHFFFTAIVCGSARKVQASLRVQCLTTLADGMG